MSSRVKHGFWVLKNGWTISEIRRLILKLEDEFIITASTGKLRTSSDIPC